MRCGSAYTVSASRRRWRNVAVQSCRDITAQSADVTVAAELLQTAVCVRRMCAAMNAAVYLGTAARLPSHPAAAAAASGSNDAGCRHRVLPSFHDAVHGRIMAAGRLHLLISLPA